MFLIWKSNTGGGCGWGYRILRYHVFRQASYVHALLSPLFDTSQDQDRHSYWYPDWLHELHRANAYVYHLVWSWLWGTMLGYSQDGLCCRCIRRGLGYISLHFTTTCVVGVTDVTTKEIRAYGGFPHRIHVSFS